MPKLHVAAPRFCHIDPQRDFIVAWLLCIVRRGDLGRRPSEEMHWTERKIEGDLEGSCTRDMFGYVGSVNQLVFYRYQE